MDATPRHFPSGSIFGAITFAFTLIATQLFGQSPVNFGTVAVGSPVGASQTVTFAIPGGSSVGTASVVTQGAPSLDFTVMNNTCTPGATGNCAVQVQFLPLAVGIRLGAVTVTDQNNNLLASTPLLGTGTGPVVTFGPGTITTFAGNRAGNCGPGCGYGAYGGDGGQATQASFSRLAGVAVDSSGDLYIADSMNNRVRMVNPSGIVTTVAGNGNRGYSGDGGPAISATLNFPATVRVDGAGNLFIADYYNNAVRMVGPSGIITTVAGNGSAGYSGDGGPATSAQLNGPWGTVSDGAGNLYIGDAGNNVIRLVSAGGTITTIAGSSSGQAGYSGDGGPATSALLNGPQLGAMDGSGNLYFADYSNNVIRVISSIGTISTYAGTGGIGYSGDGGPATSATMNFPNAVALDAAGDLYIADTGSWIGVGQGDSIVRMVAPNGIISTVAGVGEVPYAQYPGNQGYSGDGGPATSALLYGATDVALDPLGNFYIADFYNLVVRKVTVSTPPSLSFPSTLVGSTSSPQSVSVANVGNETLSAVAPGLAVGTNFIQVAGSGIPADCTTTFALALGTACNLSISFKPTAVGPLASSATLTDNTLNANPSASQSISLQGTGLGATAVVWSTPAAITYGTLLGSTQLNATATPVSAGTYIYNPPSGTLLNAGNQTLQVTFTPSNADYVASTGSVILKVNQASQRITLTTAAPPTEVYNSTFTIAATASSGLAVTYSSSGVCTNVGPTYTMTSGTGSCTLTVSQAGNGNYLAAPTVRETVDATEAVPTVSLTGAPPSAAYLSTFSVTATSNSTATPSITGNSVCSVSGTTVTMLASTGTCIVTANWNSDGNYQAAIATASVTATKATPIITWATPSPIVYSTPLGGTQLNAFASTAGTFTYSPASGTLEAAGNHTLSATFHPSSTHYTTANATVVLQVLPQSTTTSITSGDQTVTMNRNGIATSTQQISVSGYKPAGAVAVAASTGEVCSATVSAATGMGSCKLTFASTGPRTVTATYPGDNNHTGSTNSTQTITITVNP